VDNLGGRKFGVTVEEPAYRVREELSDGVEPRGRSFAVSRRTLLKAGWSVPVIISVAPAVAFAASGTSTNTQPPATTNTPGTNTNTPGTNTNTPGTNTNTPGTNAKTPGNASQSPSSSGGPTEQGNSAPQPARINRGFTG
jgi:hypothetical protein